MQLLLNEIFTEMLCFGSADPGAPQIGGLNKVRVTQPNRLT